jgi:hypothetical protein
MGASNTQDRLIGDGTTNPEAADGAVEVETTEPAAASKPMNDAERASHGVAANVERYAYLLAISVAVMLAVAGGWFYFHR